MRKIACLAAGLLLLCLQLWAQNTTVSGRVTDAKTGAPLSGVSVTAMGTNTGTKTNDEGKYSISIDVKVKSLSFSFVGYKAMEKSARASATIDVAMQLEDNILSDIVVVAYGKQKRESITGSVSKIGAAQLETRMTTNISQALAGAAPGIAATSGSGQPGSGAAIRIRGFGSVNASANPLYVVDGFPYEGFIGDLNTNDIESITLLKDASSTALYGARAANGVVMITTKKGKAATPKVNLNLSSGISQRGIDEYDRVGTDDYYPLMWQGLKHSLMFPISGTGLSESAAATQATNTIATQLVYNPYNVPNNQVVGTDGKLNPNATLLYSDFDWYGPLSKTSKRNEAALNISSKLNNSDYYLSLNYLKDEGFVMKSDYERVTARLALNSQVKSWLRAGINMSSAFVKSNQASAEADNASSFVNPFVFARGIGPIYPVHAFNNAGAPVLKTDGSQWYDYGMHPGAVNRPTGASPGRHIIYETMLNNRVDSRNSVIARTFLESKFLNYFSFTTNLGVDLNNVRTSRFQNKIVGDGVTPGGYASRSSNEYRTISMNQLLNYSQSFGKHDVGALVGHENQWGNETYFSGSRKGMNMDGNEELVNFVNFDDVTGERRNMRRDAYFSRINYGFDKKYFLDVSYRRDGSSRFSPSSRWGNFYSVGAAWSVFRENFMASTSNWLNDLKLRAAYGTVGNDALDTYYEYQALYALNWNNAAEPGALASKLNNDKLTWEVNKTKSIGLEFGLFKNRISGTIDLFDRGSSKLLFDVPQGLSSIITSRTENIGAMSNRGIEVQLNADIVRVENFKWDIQLNTTSLKNEITKLPNGNPITSGTKRLAEGKDIFAFYLRKWYGVDPTDGAGLFYAAPGISSGYRLSSKGDTVTTDPTKAKFDYAGSAIPKFFGSITNTFNFKGISLSCLLNYQVGGKFYDGNYAGLLAVAYGRALHTDALRAWKAPGDITDIPRLDISNTANFNNQSDRFLIDASYLNIRNITLGYALPKSLLGKMKVDQCKVYAGSENLYIFSKRKGMNPAESFNGTNSAVYVPNRLFSAGVNVTF